MYAQTYPVQKKFHTAEFLRTIPHLRSRIPHNALLIRLRSQMIASTTRYFESRGFLQTHTPIITSSDAEGAGEVFQVERSDAITSDQQQPYFGSPKYLTVSSQLHLEALAQSVGKVWTLSPTFRAEKSDTARHLSEFYMLEAEESFIGNLNGVMDTVESLIRHLVTDLSRSSVGEDIELWHARDKQRLEETGSVNVRDRWLKLLGNPWPQISYAQAVERLHQAVLENESIFEAPVSFNEGLQTEHERFLADDIGKGSPVFVTDYPRDIKPFYMAPSGPVEESHSVTTAACFDLLMPEVCEVAGGSLREHRYEELKRAMVGQAKRGSNALYGKHYSQQPDEQTPDQIDPGVLDWYLDLRKYGSVPHGGFGLGFDRLLAYLSGTRNIRDVVTFPRWYGRCTC